MRETLSFPQLFHCPAQVTSCTLLSHEGILPLPEAPALVRGSGVSFSRWCSCGVLSLTVYSGVWVEGIRLLPTVLVKRWILCKILCKNIWGAHHPIRKAWLFRHSRPLPAVAI